MNKPFLFISLSALLPLLAFAQAPRDAFEVLQLLTRWVGAIVPTLLGAIMLIIFWNLGQFILHAGDERERERYKQFMIWSVVSMFLILSFWGITYAIARSFFGSTTNPVLTSPGYVDRNGVPAF